MWRCQKIRKETSSNFNSNQHWLIETQQKKRTSPPSQISEIACGLRSLGIKFPRIGVNSRVEVDIREWAHHKGACGDDFAIDIHLRADVLPHRDMGLSDAERFTDELVKDGCLVFPCGEWDR